MLYVNTVFGLPRHRSSHRANFTTYWKRSMPKDQEGQCGMHSEGEWRGARSRRRRLSRRPGRLGEEGQWGERGLARGYVVLLGRTETLREDGHIPAPSR